MIKSTLTKSLLGSTVLLGSLLGLAGVSEAAEASVPYTKTWTLSAEADLIDLQAKEISSQIDVLFEPTSNGPTSVTLSGNLPQKAVNRINDTTSNGQQLRVNLNGLKAPSSTVERQTLTIRMGTLNRLRNLAVASGNYTTTINDSVAERTSVASVKGEIKVNNADVNTLNIASATGTINVNDSVAKVATSVASSLRPIRVTNLSTGFLNAANTTGLTEIVDSQFANGAIAAATGGVNLLRSDFKSIEVATATGAINVDKPTEFSGRINARSFRKATVVEHDTDGTDLMVLRSATGKINVR